MSVFTNPADGAPAAAAAYIEAVLGMLGDREARPVLAATAAEFRDLVAGVDEGQLRRPESPGRWSVGQVLAHMVDSDLAWAWRLRMILAHDRPSLGGYDQEAWARRLRYEDADPRASLERFAQVRSINLDLLDRVPDADFDRVGVHAERGEESVRHLMRLYAGHDLVHLAQVRRILAGESSTQEQRTMDDQRGSVTRADDVESITVGAGRGTVVRVLIDDRQAPNYALRKFTMQPGGGMPRHTNRVEHEQYVLRGRARIGIGDEEFEVGPDDVVYIPAGVPHFYESIGDEPFEFLCTVPNRPDEIEILDD